MEYKKMHRAYRPTIGGFAVPVDKMINDLGDKAIYYIGTFSEFNPIGLDGRLALYVRKQTTESINQQKEFKLPGFKLKKGLGYHGEDFNNNTAVKFTKEDLLRIANAMDDTDELQIALVDNIDRFKFEEQIKIITK